MLVKTYASAILGISASTVTIEVEISAGINFFMVGLPDSAVKESQRRIESALRSAGYEITKKRVVINLAPADLKKEGSAYDLPLAVGILAASGVVTAARLPDYVIMGELSLDGSLVPVHGALSMALHARESGFRGIILPAANAKEAGVVGGLEIYGMKNLGEVVRFLSGDFHPEPYTHEPAEATSGEGSGSLPDFTDVKGQAKVKRALEIAAAGAHNLLMIGPPGSGKTMLAHRLPGILPGLSPRESVETTRIHSVAGKLGNNGSLITRSPFRDPHHTISDVAMVGGGAYPQPGEISLAHNGVLFMDELPEFRRNVLEVLRQPMESRMMTISRAKFTVRYPADFMLVAAMNPCPCGYYNHPDRECECPPGAVQKYLSRVSGPLLDRIDIHIEVTPVPFRDLTYKEHPETSKRILERVIRARRIQQERFRNFPEIRCNARISPSLMIRHCRPDEAGAALLRNAMDRLDLSARAYDRILKVARTIADLDGSEAVRSHHLAEAINYRSLDRKGWGG
jgi:magnesium chelatase family protein